MRGQADATQSILNRLPARQARLDRIKVIEDGAGGNVSSISQTESGRLFYLRRNPGDNQFKLVWRDSAAEAGKDTVVFDPQTASTPGQPRAIMDFAPSRDGSKLAYAVQVGGQEIGTLHVIDVATGRPLIEPIDRIRYSGVNWLEDGSGFFFSRLVEGYEQLPAGRRFENRTAHFRALDAAATDWPVFSASRNPELALPSYIWPSIVPMVGTAQALAWVGMGVDRNLTLLAADLQDAAQGRARRRSIAKPADEITGISAGQNFMYFRSAKGAPRLQILRVPLADLSLANLSLASAEMAVAQGSGSIAQMAAAADALYFTRRDGVNTQLYRVAHRAGALPEAVQLPVQGHVQISSHHPKRDGVIVTLASWASAAKPYYTQSARMAIYVGSAGGIFVGGAIAERPDLFAAAVPAVGVMDTIHVESSANGPANVPEYGTVKNEKEFKDLLAMSSYHQLRDGVRYPAVMAIHGVNDIRVDVWQSAKFVSRPATATRSGKPALMRREYDSGHGQGSTRAQLQERSTDLYSFLLWQSGMPGFQPLP